MENIAGPYNRARGSLGTEVQKDIFLLLFATDLKAPSSQLCVPHVEGQPKGPALSQKAGSMLPEDRNEPAGEDGNRSILCPPSPDALLWGPEATSRGRMGKPSSEGHRLVSEGEVRPQARSSYPWPPCSLCCPCTSPGDVAGCH